MANKTGWKLHEVYINFLLWTLVVRPSQFDNELLILVVLQQHVVCVS